jgi:hypothetical protein
MNFLVDLLYWPVIASLRLGRVALAVVAPLPLGAASNGRTIYL